MKAQRHEPAQRVPGQDNALKTQVVQQCRHISDDMLGAERAHVVRHLAAPMPAHIPADHAEPVAKGIDLPLPHRRTCAIAMRPQDGGAAVLRDAVILVEYLRAFPFEIRHVSVSSW